MCIEALVHVRRTIGSNFQQSMPNDLDISNRRFVDSDSKMFMKVPEHSTGAQHTVLRDDRKNTVASSSSLVGVQICASAGYGHVKTHVDFAHRKLLYLQLNTVLILVEGLALPPIIRRHISWADGLTLIS
ncbi:hypothetical protein P3342_002853 [Pyrenophora teres f. teres]|nr:hypothetical protein P3342_002853 [Pyrenophora teres f. teres]